MANVRLNDVARALFKDRPKLSPTNQSFTRSNWNTYRPSDLYQGFDVLRWNRFFTKIWMKFFHRLDVLDR